MVQRGKLASVTHEVDALRASLARMAAAGDDLRRQIERSLHDGVQQDLVALGVRLQLARQLAESDQQALLSLLDEIERDARQALDDVRQLAWRIFPALLLDHGLVEALRATVSDVEAHDVGRYPPEIEAAVYFACVDAKPTAVRLREEDRMLLFELCVDAAQLDGVADRVAAVGGQMTLTYGEGSSVWMSAAVSAR